MRTKRNISAGGTGTMTPTDLYWLCERLVILISLDALLGICVQVFMPRSGSPIIMFLITESMSALFIAI